MTSQGQAKTWVDNKLAEIAAAEASRSVKQPAPTKLSSYERPAERSRLTSEGQSVDGPKRHLTKSEAVAILKMISMDSVEVNSYLSSAVVSAFAQQKID